VALLSGLLLGLALGPGRAAAQGTDGQADATALVAYHRYLSALAGPLAAPAANRVEGVVELVSNRCADALAETNRLSPGQMDASAFSAFGAEVDGALTLAQLSAGIPALDRLAGALHHLTWTGGEPAGVTARFLTAERRLVGLPRPALCADATTLGVAPLSEPEGTRRFLGRYGPALAAARSALGSFRALLSRYASPGEARLLGSINALAARYRRNAAASEGTAAGTILAELGLRT
jgi:hypothetical protein